VDIYTEAKWGDAVIEVELMVPRLQFRRVRDGEYEVQVLDSFGKTKVGRGYRRLYGRRRDGQRRKAPASGRSS